VCHEKGFAYCRCAGTLQRKYLRLAPTILHCSTYYNVYDTCYVFSRWWVNNIRIPFDSRDNALSPRKIAVRRETDSRECEWKNSLPAVWQSIKSDDLKEVKEAHMSGCAHNITMFHRCLSEKRMLVFLSLAASLLTILLLVITYYQYYIIIIFYRKCSL